MTVVPFGAYLDQAGQLVPLMLANVDVGLLAVFAIASLGIYSMILAGWASNSKYPFLGSVRASAQLISYELSLTLSVLPVFLWVNAPGTAGSLSLVRVVAFQSGTWQGFAAASWGGAWFIFLMPVSAFDLPRGALRRDQPPAVRHDRVGGRPRGRLPHGIRRRSSGRSSSWRNTRT